MEKIFRAYKLRTLVNNANAIALGRKKYLKMICGLPELANTLDGG